MLNVVLQLSEEKLDHIKKYYGPHQVERNGPGIIFAAKIEDTTITIYRSGKVMFQGIGAKREAEKFGEVKKKTSTSPSPSSIKAKGDVLPKNFQSFSVIGSDETGTGDYFGPITVAAVYVPNEKIQLLEELGVKDSKMLTDIKMREIAPFIIETLPHSILVLRNDKYNKLQQKGYSQGKMKALLHNQAIKHVLGKIQPEKPDYILIDQFVEKSTYYKYLQNEQEIVQENVLFSTKAEQLHVAVATASILARYAFLKEMDRLSEQVGMELQKGASNKVDEMAARIWKEKGEDVLRSICKWHFANTEKARKLMN